MNLTEEMMNWIRGISGDGSIDNARTNQDAGKGSGVGLAAGGSDSPASPPKQQAAPSRTLTDKDFPTDAKQRKRADEEARRKARERQHDPQGAKGKGPPVDPAEAAIADALGDPNKRLVALAQWKVPRYSEAYADDTPEIQFLADLESGTNKAQEYFEYINKACERAEKVGDMAALENVGKAAAGLKKITGKLSDGLGKAGKVIKTAKQVGRWIVAVNGFADASAAMDPRNRKSVERWVESMGRLWDATAPFTEWLQNKAATAAILEGSEAAAALSATLAVVGAELYIGIKLLDAGVKAESAYFDRMEKTMAEIDRQAGNGPAEPEPEPMPAFPGEWVSREEAAQNATEHGKEWEDSELKIKIRAAERSKRQAHEEKVFEATARFNSTEFPKVYIRHRPDLRTKILTAMRKAGGKAVEIKDLHADARTNESRWWDCLTPDMNSPTPPDTGGDSLTDAPFFDKQAGIYVYPVKARVSVEEAATELAEFARVRPPCPFVKAMHDAALKDYLAKNVKDDPT